MQRREERVSPGACERFLREARLAAQLRHPYAAQVYAFGTADGGRLLWIAMELVQGVSLADWLQQHSRMPPERFVPFFDHVCQVVPRRARQGGSCTAISSRRTSWWSSAETA